MITQDDLWPVPIDKVQGVNTEFEIIKKNAMQTTDLFWIVWLQESENMSHVSCGQSHVCFDVLIQIKP